MVRRTPKRNVEAEADELSRARPPRFRFPDTLLGRPRLEQQFQRAARYRLTVVHGPSGTGKSTAIDAHARAITHRAALYIPNPRAADLIPFVRGLSDALAGLFPAVGPGLFSAAQSAECTPRPALALGQWFAGRLESRAATVILDDLHLVDDCNDVAEFIATIVEHSGPDVRWILGMRSTGSMPIAKWLAADIVDLHIDEKLLALTADEAIALAGRLCVGTEEALRALQVTGPHAEHFTLALRTGQLSPLSLEDRRAELLSRFSQYLSRDRLQALYALLQLPYLENQLVKHIPLGRDVIKALDSNLPWAFRLADRPRFASAFQMLLRDACPIPEDAFSEATHLAVSALEAAGRGAEALRVAALGRSSHDVLRLLTAGGFELMNRGAADTVQFAVHTLSRADRRLNSVALALEAMRESDSGRHDVADAWFSHAIQSATEPLASAHVQYLYAKDLLRRDRLDCIDILERLKAQSQDLGLQAAAIAALGAAYGKAQRSAESRACATEAIARIDDIVDVSARATVYQHAAFAATLQHDADAAERFGHHALSIAREHGLDLIAASALTVLCYSALTLKDDVFSGLRHATALKVTADFLGNAFFRRWTSLFLIDVHSGCGDWREVARAEEALAGEEVENDDHYANEVILPARALKLACRGDFADAYRLLESTTERQVDMNAAVIRSADIALYAAAAGLWNKADDAIKSARGRLMELSAFQGATIVRASLNIVLASLLLADGRGAASLLNELQDVARGYPRLRCYHALLRPMLKRQNGARNHEEILQRLDELARSGLGGVAAMIEAIPTNRLELRRAA